MGIRQFPSSICERSAPMVGVGFVCNGDTAAANYFGALVVAGPPSIVGGSSRIVF